MPPFPPPPSSGNPEKESQGSGGLLEVSWDRCFVRLGGSNTCGGSFYWHTTPGVGLELCSGCNGVRLTYYKV
jgi:hypothetical protein